MRKAAPLSLLVLAFCHLAMAQAPQDEERIITSTTEVVLDVVVKDRKGRPAKNLAPSDFEIYEDGVRQEIKSFEAVVRTVPSAEPPRGIAAHDAETSRRTATRRIGPNSLSAVALVFDRLSPDARARASKAALGYFGNAEVTSDFVAVFAIDQRLHTLQPFTRDARLVRQTLNALAARGSSPYASDAAQTRDLVAQQAALVGSIANAQATIAGAGPTNAGAVSATASTLGASAVEQRIAEIQTRVLETFERLERDQQGYATTNALLAVINALGRLAGRKAIVFFSEGVAIPPAVEAEFRSVIGNANRANVSIYAVDAAGLRIESTTAETQRELQALGARRINQASTGREDTSGQPMTRLLERNEDLLRFDPHTGLSQLADSTGGRLISGTNDIGAHLREVDQDLHAYYVLTYVPKNTDYDGKFRQIAVKLNRSDLEVQTRRGYYAINAAIASPVLAYEAPALALLSGAHRSNAFPLHLGGFNFPEKDRPGMVSVVVEIPPEAITYATNAEKKTYQTDFVVLALIKDESLRVVRKLSNQYVLTGPMERLDRAKRGEILFYREAELPPGRYTISVAAYDALSGRASVESAEVEVVDQSADLPRLSSLVILKRAERLPPQSNGRKTPFHYGEVVLYPNLNEPLSKNATKQLAFFLTAYAPPNGAGPKLLVEVLRSGHPIGRAAVELPAPDAQGRIQYASAIPVEKLAPGEYELRATLVAAATRVSRTARFELR